MRFLIRIALIALLFGGAYFFIFKPQPPTLSEAQLETVETFGYPHQFVISYIPTVGTDEKEQSLARNEIWYYPKQELKIHFLAGKVFKTDSYIEPTLLNVASTQLRPEEIHFELSLGDLTSLLNEKPTELDFFDLENDENYDSTFYGTEDAIFMMEHGKLTFFQTIAVEKEDTSDEN